MNNEEAKLYNLLASEPTRVFTKEEIIRSLFPNLKPKDTINAINEGSAGPTRALDRTAVSLRDRLREEDPDAQLIVNVWGIGYRFTD